MIAPLLPFKVPPLVSYSANREEIFCGKKKCCKKYKKGKRCKKCPGRLKIS